jgi:hypothetical protein
VTEVTEYRVPSGVLRAEVNGQEVLLNTSTGIYHVLNPTGRRMLLGLEQGWSIDRCVSSIVEESDVTSDRAEADADAFISDLLERKLLEAMD